MGSPPKYLLAVRTVLLGHRPAETLRRLVLLVIATVVLFGGLFRVVLVRGRSMEPTLNNGEWHLATRWWFDAQRRPSRGDIVVIHRPGGRMFYVKRILGLPGETVEFKNGILLIDGQAVPEPWRSELSDWTMPAIQLGPAEYFVAGDNRAMPMIDHLLGRVSRERLSGRIIL